MSLFYNNFKCRNGCKESDTTALLNNKIKILNHHVVHLTLLIFTEVAVKVTQLCPTLRPHGLYLLDFSFHGILQARTLEWVAVPFLRGLSQLRG